ncbi:hypothetical protein [Micromonospora sp. NPDC005174]|uniref:hypothetical protein n=1 Tax=Micromonospora sp. NPDC005174 TaxID=3157018 RepID=UPI0033A43B07
MTDVARLKVRNLGSGRSHYADVPSGIIRAASVLGCDCRVVAPPIAALCGVVLGTRGPDLILVMRDTVAVGCRACVKIADLSPAVSHG